ncbi:hypothetical protein WJX74_002412 [Apatococcus lobatus]|uniref:Nucleoid-associated protein n=1 Tax=Apatococcus lobatus TaxID=904363 RepID=A0AAW1QYP1_9CHLO
MQALSSHSLLHSTVQGSPLASRRSCGCLHQRRPRFQPTRALFGGKKDGEGGGGNPFSKLGDMNNFMKSVTEAQKLVQGQAQQIQAELAVTEFDGYSDDETVKVVMTGNQEPKFVDITDEAMENSSDRLAELVTEALKDAHSKSVEGMKTRMQDFAKKLGVTPGSLPGF